MQVPLGAIAPQFVELAHRTGKGVAATVDASKQPRTRVVQPVWSWDGGRLTGWLSTDTTSPKYRHLLATPSLSITYWNQHEDTCSADCDAELVDGLDEKASAWERFRTAPPPAGFDPAVHPDWESASSPTFGVVVLRPRWLRVMPGSLMTQGVGEVLTWRSQ